ncbi:MAG: phosphatase PAP2 family protein [Halanaerobiales bacterium]
MGTNFFGFTVVNAADFDKEVRTLVLDNETEFIDRVMSGVTHLGHGVVDFSIASSLPDEEARKDAQKSLFVGGISAITLKTMIGKKRPPGPIEYQPFTIESSYHSMPSGHTTTAFALATTIANHYPKYKKLSYSFATLVGISRLYEDVHWASDVISGAGLGFGSAKFVEYKW